MTQNVLMCAANKSLNHFNAVKTCL